METWKYIEILRRPNKTWFFSKDNTIEKIDALTKIANDGYPSLISSLTDFLKDNNKEIRETTCKTIIHLFKKNDNKKGYYDTLKYCDISKNDIDFYKTTFSDEEYVELLAISSLNGNGYVREKAVEKLSQVRNPRAIQFLIYRLADWVLPVRRAALKGIKNYKSTDYINTLIENLLIFEWLQRVERTDLSGVYQEIINFIVLTNRDFVITNFCKYNNKQRLILAKHISNSLIDYSTELRLLLTDKHFIIRSLAINQFDKLGQDEIDQLLNDKSAKIRLQTLYCLENRTDFKNIIRNYLADNSASIRHLARFTLKETEIDFSEFYNQNLLYNKQIIGSLIGLAEVEAKQFADTIKMFLYDNKIKIRKTAFLALQKLDVENSYQFALENIDSNYVGLRNIIIDFLSVTPRQEVLEKAREIYKIGNCELKKSMLKLFSNIGGWSTIPDLMIGAIDENENIRQLAFGYLQRWKTEATNLYRTPKQGELERAKQVFIFAHKTLEDKQYFKTNPIDELDFYFK